MLGKDRLDVRLFATKPMTQIHLEYESRFKDLEQRSLNLPIPWIRLRLRDIPSECLLCTHD